MSKINKTKYLILGMLFRKEQSGYTIKKWIDNQFKYFWSESYGQIYPMLKKLEEEGAIGKKYNDFNPENGRQKNIYTISEKGKEEFLEYMKKSCEEEKLKSELLLKMAFGYFIPKEYSLKNLEEFRQRELRKQIEFIELEEYLKKGQSEKSYNYDYMTLNMGKKINKAQLEWAEECIELLSNQIKEEK